MEVILFIKLRLCVIIPLTGLPQRLSDKASTCSEGDAEYAGLIPESGRPLKEEMATHSSILA